MALLPLLLLLLCYIIWGIYSWAIKKYYLIKTRATSSLVILLFLVHPNIVSFMFGVFKY